MGGKAVILAGGYGKRLRPLTNDKPKPLVEVAGKPILEWQLLWLKGYNIDTIFILSGYKKEVLVDYVAEHEDKLGVSIALLSEKDPLGTGGALKKVSNFIDNEQFIVVNGDVLTDLDISKMVQTDTVATIALVPLKSQFGIVNINEQGTITKFDEKPYIKDYWINAGVYVFSSDIFEYLPEKGDIEKSTFPYLAEKKMIKGVRFDGAYWRSIETLKDVEEASKDLEDAVY